MLHAHDKTDAVLAHYDEWRAAVWGNRRRRTRQSTKLCSRLTAGIAMAFGGDDRLTADVQTDLSAGAGELGRVHGMLLVDSTKDEHCRPFPTGR